VTIPAGIETAAINTKASRRKRSLPKNIMEPPKKSFAEGTFASQELSTKNMVKVIKFDMKVI
jgi:hypothetical protein